MSALETSQLVYFLKNIFFKNSQNQTALSDPARRSMNGLCACPRTHPGPRPGIQQLNTAFCEDPLCTLGPGSRPGNKG